MNRFGLERALIAADYAEPPKQRTAVAKLVAKHLGRTVTDGQTVAVGMGRNVEAVAELGDPAEPRHCTFVCAIGGSLRGGQYMNPDHICQRLADSFKARSEVLYAPARVEDDRTRNGLLATEPVASTPGHARRADHALIGIGDLSEDSNMVRLGWFSPQEIAAARVSGTIGDILGYDFVDIHGRRVLTPIQDRIIGLRIHDLRTIDNVIAIASESTKAAAILGALRTGVINIIATSAANAHSILKLDDATRPRTHAPLVTYR